MMRYLKLVPILFAVMLSADAVRAQEEVTLSIRNVIDRQALLFPSEGSIGAVLVHQSGYTATSWTEFAQRLQSEGVASIALESNSSEDVQSGTDFLRQLGKQRIVLIGASIGGAAVQNAASSNEDGTIKLVILMGTAEGNMSADVKKLFVVSEKDFFSAHTYSSFEKASEPKELLVYPGKAHGQEMFDDVYGAELTGLILERILQ